jgi:Immunity protein Imm1
MREPDMYVRALTKDNWEGERDASEHIKNPSWNDLETAIRALDGGRRTVVVLEGERGANLTIGGGADGRYIVCATLENGDIFTLCLSEQSLAKVTLYIGGQDGEFPDNFIVDIATAMLAAKTFAKSGQLNSTALWQPVQRH